MSGVTLGVLRAAMKMVVAADGVGDGTASPDTRRQLAARASGWASMTTVRANHVIDASGVYGFGDFMGES